MPQFLTPEQIHEIKRIIAKRHAAVVLRIIGPEALTPEERSLLEQAGILLDAQESVIRDAYLYGQLLAKLEKPELLKMNYDQFKKEVVKNPVTLSQPEEFAVKAAEVHAGAHIRHLGAKVEQQASMLVFKEDAAMRAKLLREIIPEVSHNIEKRESIGKLKKELGHLQQDWSRDWNRVAITEKTNAMNRGNADAMKEKDGDPWVFKRPMPDACFVAGTKIATRRGEIPIEEVKIGDEVLTHRLRWRKVTHLFANPYNGELFGLDGKPNMTANHPVLVDLDWRRADAIKPGDQVVKLGRRVDADDEPSMIAKQGLLASIAGSGLAPAVPVSSVQLYRYLQVRDSDIDVVWTDGEFQNGREALQSLSERDAFFGGTGERLLARFRLGVLSFWSQCLLPGLAGVFSQLTSLGLGHALQPGLLGFGAGRQFFVEFQQPSFDQPSGHSEMGGERAKGVLAGAEHLQHQDSIDLDPWLNHEVDVRRVHSIVKERFTGTVYNLEVEEDSSYFADGLAVHNCKHCIRLHIGPDGHPRIFRLSTLESNGTNVGVKTADWKPVIGTTHPHCQCQLSRVPEGWGFDAEGDLVPGGQFGVRYNGDGSVQKAMELEDQLQKSFKVQERINFGGLPIAIEHAAGSIRPWKDADGNEGETRMLFAYGFIEGTEGPDGDEYDVFVGPDPLSDEVFIIHQNNPTTGEWDEDKAMVGFPDAITAREAYLVHYDNPKFYGSMTIIPLWEFVQKVMQTKTPGSFQSDGMVKSNNTPSEVYAQTSQMGNRAISQSNAGVALVLGMPVPAGAAAPATQIKKMKEHLAGFTNKDREKLVLTLDPSVYSWQDGEPAEAVFPFVHKLEARAAMDQDVLDDIPQNQFLLDEQIAKRLHQPATNKVIKASLFIGPRGGLWADPQHTVPYKPDKPKRTPLLAQPEEKPAQKKREWKEGFPPGIPAVEWSSWKVGHRGGTEELHFDKETNAFKPERAKLHKQIVQKFFKQGKSHGKAGKDATPTAIISMGGPASGKSTMLDAKFGDLTGYVKIDADKIKEELPEYKKAVAENYKSAATIVHMESTVVANHLLTATTKAKKNLIFDTTGADFTRLQNQIQKLKAAGYRVAIVMPYIDRTEARIRSKARAEREGRWIPDEVLDDVYSKVPGSLVKALDHVETALIFDNTQLGNPREVYEKNGDTHVVHDPEIAARFPGLPIVKSEQKASGDLLELLRGLAKAASKHEQAQGQKPKTHEEGEGILDIGAVHDWISLLPEG